LEPDAVKDEATSYSINKAHGCAMDWAAALLLHYLCPVVVARGEEEELGGVLMAHDSKET
jgi:hypothetical protein